MAIQISKEAQKEAINSIQRYSRENMDEALSGLEADSLLAFFLEELAPVVYNKAVQDVQQALQARVMEVDIDVHEDEFPYWRKRKKS